MKTLRDVFLKMNSHQMHFLLGGRDIFLRVLGISEVVQRHAAIGAKWHVVLRNLIILRHVRIEIIFAIEFADWRDIAAEHEASERRHAQRLVIHHWQSARQTEANWTSVRIWLRPKLNWTGAKHFGARLEVDVHFKTNGGEIVHLPSLRLILRLRRVIERALEVEFFDAISERRVICRVDDALVLKKIEKASLRDHIGDFRIVA